MATHGNLFLKMVACGDRLQQAQERFEAHRTEEDSEEWRRARRLVDDLAGEYLAAVRAWRQSLQQQINGSEASQHINPALGEQFLLAGLPVSEIAVIAEHLRTCSECRRRINLWEGSGGIVGEQEA